MLQKMRDQTQSMGFKIIVAVLIFALAFFGFGAFNIFTPSDPIIASVNGEDITEGRLMQVADQYRRRLLAQRGDQIDADDLDPLSIQTAALDGLVSLTLLGQMVEDLGLVASPAQMDAEVRADPGFQVEGEFSPGAYKQALSAAGYTPTRYLTELSAQMSTNQLRSAISETAFTTDWETRLLVPLLEQRRDLAWLPFTVEHSSEDVQIDEADIELHYVEHEAEMMSEETVDVAYVELAWNELLDDPRIAVSDEELRRDYEADKAEAGDGDQRRSSHILLRTEDGRTEEQAQAQLRQLAERLAAGESFAELAKAHSEDLGSAAGGGDLGTAGRGVFDPAFEEALWQLQEGQVSPPVKSAFGYHLIRLDGIERVEFPSFEEQREGTRQRLRQAAARDLYQDLVRELDNLAFEQSDSLDGLAETFGLAEQSVEGVSRTSGEGAFDQADLREAVFAPDALYDGNNTAAIEYGDARAVVARVLNHHTSELRPLEQVRDEIEALLVERVAKGALLKAYDAALERLKAGDGVGRVADEHGVDWQTIEQAGRTDRRAPRPVLDAAFALARPEEGDKSIGNANLDDEGKAVVVVTRVVDGDLSALADVYVDSLRDIFLNNIRQLDFDAFYQSYFKAADISRRGLQAE